MSKQFRVRVIIVSSIVILLTLPNLYFFLVKLGGGIFLLVGLVQLVLLLTVAILTVHLITKVIRMTEWRNGWNYSTLMAITFSITFGGRFADENTFQSKVKIRACYEGTMNTSTLFFRENGEFEDFNIGFFAHVNYVHGTWKMNRDTIQLNFTSGMSKLLSDKLILKDGFLYTIRDDQIEPSPYYLGICKGLN